jgi:two-component system, NtrC family, sensor kinase
MSAGRRTGRMATTPEAERDPVDVPAAREGGRRPARDALVSIPLRHRLSTKLLGMSAVAALAALAAIWFAERRMQRDLVYQLERSTALLGDAIQVSAEEAMLADAGGHSWRVVERVGRLDGIEEVRVIDKRGRIAFSTAPAEVGSIVEADAGTCGGCHAGRAQARSRAPPELRSAVLEGSSGRVLALVSPIHNARSCATAACHVHPMGRQVLGLLEVRVSLDHLDADVLSFRHGFVLVLGSAVLVFAALLYLFGRAEVVEPVEALLEGTRRVARDELDIEIRVHSRGELGVLAASFNEMTRALRRLENDLTGFMSGLERQVEARTADLRAAQETLLRAEKLSSLGKLSASIAHEINNPLAGILTFAKLVSRTLAEGPPDEARRAALQKNLALVERETQRCSAIVRNLLDFARERPIEAKPLDPRLALDEALSLLANQAYTQGVVLERDLTPVPEVLADYGQLRQAFLNVAMNACEAMGPSGRLHVSTRCAGGSVEIVFVDTGPGIPPERLSKIFDPFFTTKEKGTGLGLSVVYGIVERHGGTVSVDSDPVRGTTFTLRLPAAAREEPRAAAS